MLLCLCFVHERFGCTSAIAIWANPVFRQPDGEPGGCSRGAEGQKGRERRQSEPNPCNHAGGHSDGNDRLGELGGKRHSKSQGPLAGHFGSGSNVGEFCCLRNAWTASNSVQYGLVAWQSCCNWQVAPPTDKVACSVGRVKNLSSVKQNDSSLSVCLYSRLMADGPRWAHPRLHGLLPTSQNANCCWNISRCLHLAGGSWRREVR